MMSSLLAELDSFAAASAGRKRRRKVELNLAYEGGSAEEHGAGEASGAILAPHVASPPRSRKGAQSPASASAVAQLSPARPPSTVPFPPPPSPGAYPALQSPPGSPAKGYGRPVAPHASWAQQLSRIKSMRAEGGVAANAAVDTMGCERCSDPTASASVRRFQTLIGLMLSSQTRDEATYAAVQRLIAANGCTPESIAAAELPVLEALLLGPPAVGFYRNKSRFIKESASLCLSTYGGDIPDTLEGLIALPGVGPKMAFITLNAAWGLGVGIGVDTHVHRIANRLGWVRTEQPEATREHLQSWMPREEWSALNVLLVGFGQTVCTPVGPHCGTCSAQDICSVGSGHKSPLVKRK
jgi:endonuclease-3